MFLLQVKVTDPCNLLNLSSGSQLLLSNVFCFVLIPRTSLFQKYVKSAFYRENVCLVVLFCIAVLSLSNVFLTRVCEWKIAEMLESSLKTNHKGILEEIFWPADSKSLSPVMVFGVHQSKRFLLSALKQFLVCSEKVRKQSFTSWRIFSKRVGNANDRL